MPEPKLHAPPFNRWQSGKGLAITAALIVAFLFFPRLPREWVALVCAGVLLLSRRMASREIMALVDWQLLVLFIGLFVVNDAFQRTGAMDSAIAHLRSWGVDPGRPAALFGLSVVLSNLVSNVPATMLLLPSATHPQAGAVLALASTLAGNLMVVGSIANIIVVTAARPLGVTIDFRTHLRTGVPVTIATLAIAAAWLALGLVRYASCFSQTCRRRSLRHDFVIGARRVPALSREVSFLRRPIPMRHLLAAGAASFLRLFLAGLLVAACAGSDGEPGPGTGGAGGTAGVAGSGAAGSGVAGSGHRACQGRSEQRVPRAAGVAGTGGRGGNGYGGRGGSWDGDGGPRRRGRNGHGRRGGNGRRRSRRRGGNRHGGRGGSRRRGRHGTAGRGGAAGTGTAGAAGRAPRARAAA